MKPIVASRWRQVLHLATGLLLVLSVMVACGGSAPTTRTDGILFESSFETGDLTGFYWHQNRPDVVSADAHPVRAGQYSMRSYLHRYESAYSYRTEVIVGSAPDIAEGTRKPFYFSMGEEYWIGFSIYAPEDLAPDTRRLTDVVFQMQASPDDGEIYRSPVFALEMDGDDWRIWRRWDERSLSPRENTFTGSDIVYQQPVGSAYGRWTDWVIHVRWSAGEDGLLQVWRDGQIVVDATGPNCSNDERGPHIALGVYKWPWKPDAPADWKFAADWRLFYHDELRIGDATAGYEGVAPRSDAATPTPEPAWRALPRRIPGLFAELRNRLAEMVRGFLR